MQKAELDFIVPDSLEVITVYQAVFEVSDIEPTDYEKGLNEVRFKLQDMQMHILDENPDYDMYAPKKDAAFPIWVNLTVTDIKDTLEKAEVNGFSLVQPLTDIPEFGVKNAVIKDPFGYQWMLHEVYESKTTEELNQAMDKKFS